MLKIFAIVFSCCFAIGDSASPSPSGKYFNAEGVVIAVQKGKDEVRMIDPHSMGELVEVWMVRVHRWSRPEKPRIILIEYTHRDSLIKDNKLDKTRWKFEIRPAPQERGGHA